MESEDIFQESEDLPAVEEPPAEDVAEEELEETILENDEDGELKKSSGSFLQHRTLISR